MHPNISDEELKELETGHGQVISWIAEHGVYFGLTATENRLLSLEVCPREIDKLLKLLGWPIDDEERAELRETLRVLWITGRLEYRPTDNGLGYLTLSADEWQKCFLASVKSAEYRNATLADLKDRAEAAGNGEAITLQPDTKPIAKWFSKRPWIKPVGEDDENK